MRGWALAAALAALLAVPSVAPAEPPARLLLFDLEILDTSGEGAHPDHAGRLERMTGVLRDGLAASGRYAVTLARESAVAAELPASVRSCNGCEVDLGRKAGAGIVATGVIHKTSTLILTVEIVLRGTGDGKPVALGVADIRGDNERSWRHGVEWLLRHRLLAPPP
ncbi:DUF3280 domain-containing protein [Azospirillum doebereinerae]